MNKVQAICACLLLWNISFGIMWFGSLVSSGLHQSSNEYGHIEDADARWEKMKPVIRAARAQALPYFVAAAVLTGPNVVLAILAMYAAKSPVNHNGFAK